MKKIGLLFGSFNPLHNGHLLAEKAQQEAGLDEVWFVVQPENTYKPTFELLDYDTRKQLIGNAGLQLYVPTSTDYKHYILDTLRELADYQLTVILGEDLMASFSQWEDYSAIKQLASIYESPRIDDISSGLIRDGLQAGSIS